MKVTPQDVENIIVAENYFTALQGARMAGLDQAADTSDVSLLHTNKLLPGLGLLTFCVLTLRNGFMVTGDSACANAEIGRAEARKSAINKVWPLLGYELKTKLQEMK